MCRSRFLKNRSDHDHDRSRQKKCLCVFTHILSILHGEATLLFQAKINDNNVFKTPVKNKEAIDKLVLGK